eukprot:1159785-Pelagomonas_calceolata.AAC.3
MSTMSTQPGSQKVEFIARWSPASCGPCLPSFYPSGRLMHSFSGNISGTQRPLLSSDNAPMGSQELLFQEMAAHRM